MKKPNQPLTKAEQDDLDVRVWTIAFRYMESGTPEPQALELAYATVELQLMNEQVELMRQSL